MWTAQGLADFGANGWTGTRKIMLMARGFLPLTTHDFVDDIVASEFGGTGYSGGFGNRKTLANLAVNVDQANKRIELDCDNPVFTGITDGVVGVAVPTIRESVNDAGSVVWAYSPAKLRGLSITAVTEANPAVVTAASHGLANGDVVYIEGITGSASWDALLSDAGGFFVIGGVTTNTFELTGVNSTAFGTPSIGSAMVYRPTTMNGADLTLTVDAEGLLQINAIA